MLNEDQKERYSRHILLDEIGEQGQEKLLSAKVLVVGAGGLGCPVLQYLAAAGVGRIGIIDFDEVDKSNLQRQILYTEEQIGTNKAFAAKEQLQKLNSGIEIVAYSEMLDTSNALQLFSQYDIIVDGSDNFSTRYLVNDACIITGKPLVYGAIFKFEGQVSVFNYQNGPSYRCLFPDPPDPGTVPSCSEIGVLGVLPGLIGIQQANEVLKIILEKKGVLSGRLLMINALESQFSELQVSRDPVRFQEVLDDEEGFEGRDYEILCSPAVSVKEILASSLKEKLSNENIQLIDVREPGEPPKAEGLNAENIPLGDLMNHINKVSKDKEVVVFCRSGKRSEAAIRMLKEKGDFNRLTNLKGGVLAWLDELQENKE